MGEVEITVASEFEKIISTKKDAEKFANLIAKAVKEANFLAGFTYHWDKGVTNIGYSKDGFFWIYSSGQGWSDMETTHKDKDEIIKWIWNERKWINKELKATRKYLAML